MSNMPIIDAIKMAVELSSAEDKKYVDAQVFNVKQDLSNKLDADAVRYLIDSEYIETVSVSDSGTETPVDPTPPSDEDDDPTDNPPVNPPEDDEPDEPTETLVNLFDRSAITEGYTLSKTTGALSTSATYFASDFIPVVAGKKYCSYNWKNDRIEGFAPSRVIGYNADKQKYADNPVITWHGSFSIYSNNGVEIPSGCAYIRFAHALSSLENNITFIEDIGAIPDYLPEYGATPSMASAMMFSADVPSLASVQQVKRLKGSDYVTEGAIKTKVSTQQVQINGKGDVKATYGADIAPALNTWTPSGSATWTGSEWQIPAGEDVHVSIPTTVGKVYRITTDAGIWNGNTNRGEIANFYHVALDDSFISHYCAGDYLPDCAITAVNATSVLKVTAPDGVGLKLRKIRVVQVTSMPNYLEMFRDRPFYGYRQSWSFGGQSKLLYESVTGDFTSSSGEVLEVTSGQKNTSFGSDSHKNLATGCWNTAFGFNSQRDMSHGKGNTAVGCWAQSGMTFGYYNNAFGESCQGHMTTAMWNDAHGIESQGYLTSGCNNVAMGRRSQHKLTTGCRNTSIGAWSGFMANDMNPEGAWALVEDNNTTLIGASSTKCSADNADNLTCVGYRSRGTKDGTAVGMEAQARGVGSIAIGKGAVANDANEMVLGSASIQIVKIAGKTISFNADGTVTWS